MDIDILCLFPEFFSGPLDVSMIKRARDRGILNIDVIDIRQFSTERFRKVDDRPYGGGPGMVMMADPVASAIRSRKRAETKTIYLSPQGATLTARKCRELAHEKHLILLSGHYEGIDQRVIDSDVDEELSIGDYVLTNGSLAALVLLDAVSRFVPGVLGDETASLYDSFEQGLLDWPHYTRPEEFEGKKVPEVLISGDHAKIARWRLKAAEEKTEKVRPDLWKKYQDQKLQ
ncbi:MAG: tRNA (guanosine(37)-N1)-methyltransferase TrmD [Verrucomicrobia bacterium]|nr:tRNA (guanosine(37)-N1)-methyltransferase TrmD [Verrucomicrobiota bacterium]MBS0637802.1 tRNA (guanosine(37)-N1)-methyltransferase TrmD [Verrucomicrobiota bacterium]